MLQTTYEHMCIWNIPTFDRMWYANIYALMLNSTCDIIIMIVLFCKEFKMPLNLIKAKPKQHISDTASLMPIRTNSCFTQRTIVSFWTVTNVAVRSDKTHSAVLTRWTRTCVSICKTTPCLHFNNRRNATHTFYCHVSRSIANVRKWVQLCTQSTTPSIRNTCFLTSKLWQPCRCDTYLSK